MKCKTIILLVTLIVMLPLSSAGASDIDAWGNSSASILSWSPPVVDYVYVNDTVNRTVTYSITTSGQITENNWTLDGAPVNGIIMGNTISYTHTWDKKDAGFHTLTYGGSKNNTQIAFRWYVNVYETGQYGGGNLFDVIDDVLENHATDVKIRMLKYTIEKHGSGSNLTAIRIKRLHDEIAGQRNLDTKYNIKLAKELAKIARDDMKDEGLADEFNKLSKIKSGREKEENGTEADNGKATKLDKINSGDNKDAGNGNLGSGGVSGSSGSPGDSGKSKDNGKSKNSGRSGSSGDSQNSGKSGNNDDSGNSGGSSGNSVSAGNGGNSGSSGSSEDSGKSKNSGKSGNSGSSESSGGSGDSGKTGGGGGTGNNGGKGNSGNNGNSGKDKK